MKATIGVILSIVGSITLYLFRFIDNYNIKFLLMLISILVICIGLLIIIWGDYTQKGENKNG
jgi:H+/Cl- antiporter ClcA